MKTTIRPANSTPVFRFIGPARGSGVECKFFTRSKSATKGYKIYDTINEAKKARARQDKAYRSKLAPKPGALFIAITGKKRLRLGYGYQTQVAKRANYWVYTRQYEKVREGLNKLGIPTWDMGMRNCGQIGKRLVMVDFGNASCG